MLVDFGVCKNNVIISSGLKITGHSERSEESSCKLAVRLRKQVLTRILDSSSLTLLRMTRGCGTANPTDFCHSERSEESGSNFAVRGVISCASSRFTYPPKSALCFAVAITRKRVNQSTAPQWLFLAGEAMKQSYLYISA